MALGGFEFLRAQGGAGTTVTTVCDVSSNENITHIPAQN
jgi:hypothetical protein